MTIDVRARVGFDRAAERYERARPVAPPAAVDALIRTLALSERSTVLELGAGTGKLSRLLAPRTGRYLALEPVRGMRVQFRRAIPRVPLLAGVAEQVPVRSSSVDAVTVAQAFHWFDAPRAIGEMHRVLRPGGKVALVWNARDETVDWVHRITGVVDQYDDGHPRFRDDWWRRSWEGAAGFEPLRLEVFPFVHMLDRETTLDRFTSVSFIASLAPREFAEAEEALRTLLDTHPQTAGRDEIELPYRCEIYSTQAI